MAQHPEFRGVDAAALTAFAPSNDGTAAPPRFELRPDDAP